MTGAPRSMRESETLSKLNALRCKRVLLNGLSVLILLSCGVLYAQASYDDLLARARSALAGKDYSAAATASQEAIKMDERRWEAYAVAANAYTGQGQYDDAIDSLRAALARAPEERKQ